MKICPHCSGSIPDQARFCGLCGNVIPEESAPQTPAPETKGYVCSSCGEACEAGKKFCGKCGSPVVEITVNASTGTAEAPATATAETAKAEKPKREKPERKPADKVKEKKPRTPGKAHPKAAGVFKWIIVGLIAAVLVSGLGYSFCLGADSFRPVDSESETSSATVDDGIISVTFEYTPSELKQGFGVTTDAKITVQNMTEHSVDSLRLSYTLPAGLSSDAETLLKAESLGPGSSRSFTLPVSRIDPLDENFLPIVLVMAATAAVTVGLIFLFAKASRASYLPVTRIASIVIAAALVIPMAAGAVYSVEPEISSPVLVYDEEDGVARELSVDVKSRGSFDFGKGADGDLYFEAKYERNQRLSVDIVPNVDERTLRISWDKISGAAEYKIYKAGSDMSFYEHSTVEDSESEVSINMDGDSVSYFRVAAVLEKGELVSGDSRVMMNGEAFSADGDCDLLSDSLEEAFGTSKVLADTDGDGLDDYTEICVTFTDPLVYDSVEPGVSDGDADPDGDGLVNLTELQLGTNPTGHDSDLDGVTDGDEVNTYKSDPLLSDTDGDGLVDGDEVFIGSDPTVTDSNGDGLDDRESVFNTTVKAENSDAVSLTVTDKGVNIPTTSVTDITEKTTIGQMSYVASPIVNVMVPETSVGTITLPITSVPEGADTGDVDLVIFNDSEGSFTVIEGGVISEDGSTISAPIPEGSYVTEEVVTASGETVTVRRVVCTAFYVANWHAAFESALTPDREGSAQFDVEFVIDESGSMEDSSKSTPNDPNRFRVLAAKNFTMGLMDGDRAGVVGFSTSASRKIALSSDKVEVCAAIDTISGHGGGTALYTGLDEALNELLENEDESRGRFIIALTDGEDNDDNTEEYDRIIQTCVDNDIPIFTIGLGSSVNTNLLSKLALYTGGSYHHIATAEDLPMIFNRIESNAYYGDDTDGDGLADSIEEYGLRDGEGKVYMTDVSKRFTDGDDMDDGEEAGGVIYQTVDEDGREIRYYVMLTDPTLADTDGDGVDDLDERLLGTLPWCSDSDGDGLVDGDELAAGYNPLIKNYDGDSFSDYEEYNLSKACDDIESFFTKLAVTNEHELLVKAIVLSMGVYDPYTYDLSATEKGSAFLQGAVIGDFGDLLSDAGLIKHELTDSVYYLAGKVIIGFVPVANVAVAIRDAVANVIKGDLVGAALSLTGLIPEAGSAVKAISDVCSFLSHLYNAYGVTSQYAGKIEVSHIAAVPAFSFVIFRALRAAEDLFGADLSTDDLDAMVNAQIDRGVLGITKTNIPLWEKFLAFDDGRYKVNRVSEILTSYQTVQIPLGSTATPLKLAETVRAAMGVTPGGVLYESTGEYVLVRAFDLESSELQQYGTLEIAFKDAIDRTAKYVDADIPDLKHTLKLVITDAMISDDCVKIFETAEDYAESAGVDLQFYIYQTSDDPYYNDFAMNAEKSDKTEAVILVPGITGSELVAGEEYVGANGYIVNEGDTVWLPIDVDTVSSLVVNGGSDIIQHALECMNLLQMNDSGKPIFKLSGKVVSSTDTTVGAMNYWGELYSDLYTAYSGSRDVIFFSYDWRNSVTEAAGNLETYINNRGYEKVTFVCHSMGGLVTSCYLSRSEANVGKTERVITIGTPYGGSPKALAALQVGKFLDFSAFDLVIKDLAYNMPSLYELLPYQDLVANGGEYLNTGGDDLLSADSTASWLKKSASVSADKYVGINKTLYERAAATETLIYSGGDHIMNRSNIDVHVIAGYNSSTVVELYEEDGYLTGYGVSNAGDGTVPLRSAITAKGKLFDNPVYLVSGVTHSDLLKEKSVSTLVQTIINTGDGSSAATGNITNITGMDEESLEELLNMEITEQTHTTDPVAEAVGKLYDFVVLSADGEGESGVATLSLGTGLNVVRLSTASADGDSAAVTVEGAESESLADDVTGTPAESDLLESDTAEGAVTDSTDGTSGAAGSSLSIKAIVLLCAGGAMIVLAAVSIAAIELVNKKKSAK